MFEASVSATIQALIDRVQGLAASDVVALIAMAILVPTFQFLRRQVHWLVCLFGSRRRALDAVARESSSGGMREGRGLWLSTPLLPPPIYTQAFPTKVLIVANNKGGVAKTTLSANLGAVWARDWKKRVLLIDLDYQGSLSTMALPDVQTWRVDGLDSLATRAISGDLDPGIFIHAAKPVPREPNLYCVPAYVDLAQADNRLIVEWLLRCRARPFRSTTDFLRSFLIGRPFELADMRFNLLDLLQTPAVANAFDLILIDCPPRLSTGVIQAMNAATHLLVPTLLDPPSVLATLAFCEEIKTIRSAGLAAKLTPVGIVATMTSPNVDQIAERQGLLTLGTELKARQLDVPLLDKDFAMRQSTAFVNHDAGIAYLESGNGARAMEIRRSLGKLADHLARRIGLPIPADGLPIDG